MKSSRLKEPLHSIHSGQWGFSNQITTRTRTMPSTQVDPILLMNSTTAWPIWTTSVKVTLMNQITGAPKEARAATITTRPTGPSTCRCRIRVRTLATQRMHPSSATSQIKRLCWGLRHRPHRRSKRMQNVLRQATFLRTAQVQRLPSHQFRASEWIRQLLKLERSSLLPLLKDLPLKRVLSLSCLLLSKIHLQWC